MWKNIQILSFLLSLGSSQTSASSLLKSPLTKWEQKLVALNPSEPAAGVYRGNGVFIDPDFSNLIAVSADGKVSSYDPESGNFLWAYEPPAVGEASTFETISNSGMTFGSSFMVYAINYESPAEDDTDYTRVIALDMSGEELYVSEQLEGLHSGNPVISSDDGYIFMNHNSDDNTVGHFTMLSPGEDGVLETVKTSTYNKGPFAPIGIFHNPAEGFYDPIEGVADGTANTNDMLMWGTAPEVSGTTVPNGFTFGFQFPVDFGDAEDVDYFVLGGSRAFRMITPPVISNQGRAAYFAASRSRYYNFIGKENLNRVRFNRGPNSKPEFTGNPQWNGQPCFAAPAVISDESGASVIFAGTASAEFFRMENSFNDSEVESELITKETSSFVYATALLDPMSRAVYYAESSGALHQADFDSLDDLWGTEILGGIQGEMALNEDGSVLYLASTNGQIYAMSVAGAPIAAPTNSPPTPGAPSVAFQPTAEGDDDDDDQPSGGAAKSMMLGVAVVVFSLFLV